MWNIVPYCFPSCTALDPLRNSERTRRLDLAQVFSPPTTFRNQLKCPTELHLKYFSPLPTQDTYNNQLKHTNTLLPSFDGDQPVNRRQPASLGFCRRGLIQSAVLNFLSNYSVIMLVQSSAVKQPLWLRSNKIFRSNLQWCFCVLRVNHPLFAKVLSPPFAIDTRFEDIDQHTFLHVSQYTLLKHLSLLSAIIRFFFSAGFRLKRLDLVTWFAALSLYFARHLQIYLSRYPSGELSVPAVCSFVHLALLPHIIGILPSSHKQWSSRNFKRCSY